MRKLTIYLSLLSLAAMGLLPALTQAQTFTIGAATADITPLNNGFPRMFLAGYASRGSNPATGVSSYPVQVRVLAIKDSFGQKIIVSADILGFTRELHEQISTLAQYKYQVRPENLMLGASHTHSGPVLKDNLSPAVTYGLSAPDLDIVANYTNWLRDKIVDTIGQALSAPSTTATAAYGVGLATDLAAFRTPLHGAPAEFGIGAKTSLPEVNVLFFRDAANSKVLAILFSYACHATYNGNTEYHSDWPGIAASELEQQYPGAVALFRQGAGADLNPNGNLFTVAAAGKAIKDIIADVIDGRNSPLVAAGAARIGGPIRTSYMRIDLPLDVYNQGDTVDAKNQETATHTLLRSSYQKIAAVTNPTYRLHALQMLDAIDSYSLPVSEPLPIQVWYSPPKDGTAPLLLVATGGELVAGYATVIKNQARALVGNNSFRVWVSAYANEVPGYIASDEYLWNPDSSEGYESGWTKANIEGVHVADGSQLYYGNPARLRPSTLDSSGKVAVPGVEQMILTTVSNMIGAITK